MADESNRVLELFLAALERPTPAERAGFLDDACAADPALRRRLDALLSAHDRPDPVLDRPAAEHLAAGDPDSLDFLEPSGKPGSLGRLGHYEVQEVVGRGGFGIVLRAFDEKLHRVVALKVLDPALAGSGPARQRFVREARAAAAVSHDNVIGIYAVEDGGPVPYIAMQFVAGKTLQQKLDGTGPLPLPETLRIGLQVAEGLAAAHRHGLVHRDIKPANILLENGVERVRITDFGLARAADDASLTRSGVVAGTPAYMSPEQADGEHVDHRSDLFSLGSVLYAMCAGHPPFRAESAMAVLRRVCLDTPRPLREVNPAVPVWLEAVVARLQAKAPGDRFAAATEVAVELSRHLAALQSGGVSSTLVTKVGPVPRAASPGRRNVRRWGTLALVLAVVVGGTWLIAKNWSGGAGTADGGNPDGSKPAAGADPGTQPAPAPPAPAPPGPAPAEPVVLQPALTLRGHVGWIMSMAVSPDGKVLASGSWDKSIVLWDTRDWRPRGARLLGHTGAVMALAFSPDGSKLASVQAWAKDRCAIRLWDVATGEPAGTVGDGWAGLYSVAWMADGKTLVTAGQDNQLNFWDVDAGRKATIDKVCTEHAWMSIKPGGKLIATGGSGPTRLWDADTRQEVPSKLPPNLIPIFVPPDGAELAGTEHETGRISLCSLASGEPRSWKAHPGTIGRLDPSPDGRFLASIGGEGTGYVWSAATTALVATLRGHQRGAAQLVFMPEGDQLVTGGLDDHAICVWNLPPVCRVRKP
jgi:serine/threonine protein kinase/WD40 repeat protein